MADERDAGTVTVPLVEWERLRAVERAVGHVRGCWDALCRCVDEFEPEDMTACGEYRDFLDSAIVATIGAADAGRDAGEGAAGVRGADSAGGGER